MTPSLEPPGARVTGFRTKLLLAMMLLVSAVTLLALYFAQERLADNVEDDLQRAFQGELAAFDRAQEVRRLTLMERCRALLRRQRIRACFEDDALDLLYLNAEDELRDVIARQDEAAPEKAEQGLQAQFYRFLNRAGAVIPPPSQRAVGALAPDEEAQLALPGVAAQPQIGYVARRAPDGRTMVSEIIAMPIFSFETGEVLAALVLGFRPFEFSGRDAGTGMKSGIWMNHRLHATDLPASVETFISQEANQAGGEPVRVTLDGAPHLLFSKRLNPESAYPPAYEACVYSLANLPPRQRKLRWQVLGAGAFLLLIGLAGSHVVAGRLSVPVEKLAVASEENRAQRVRAEAALEMTSAELQRSARFSADASHQLKTPVTVMRAGLEELLAREHLTPQECAEVSALIHQTYRLSSLIEDLLLLSRMDAGRLKLEFTPVNLSQLIEAALDDLSALPDELALSVETDFPSALHIAGEKRYTTIILQNLLENARKYNCRSGRIRIAATAQGDIVRLAVGNTGRPISAESQARIFERFHRGVMGENVPGYGLGLNLARELARLHEGDLRLLRSEGNWTEFEVRFRLALPATNPAADV
ncbi:sensor histidine kinase [Horticoccus sp. 23ND18S-11]|uniref:sensor histidine kinase n=1 Tax=Horticoccus sp. 23ND18S-11 TaxID=3391832 RepID=UPI0039C93074